MEVSVGVNWLRCLAFGYTIRFSVRWLPAVCGPQGTRLGCNALVAGVRGPRVTRLGFSGWLIGCGAWEKILQ